MAIKEVSASLGVVVVLVGAGIAFQEVSSRADEANEAVERVEERHVTDTQRLELQNIQIGEWIEESEVRRYQDESNLRALCAVEELAQAYCETRGFQFGSSD